MNRPTTNRAGSLSLVNAPVQPRTPARVVIPSTVSNLPRAAKVGGGIGALVALMGMAGVPEMQPPAGTSMVAWLIQLAVMTTLPSAVWMLIQFLADRWRIRKELRAKRLRAQALAIRSDTDPSNDHLAGPLEEQADDAEADALALAAAAKRIPRAAGE